MNENNAPVNENDKGRVKRFTFALSLARKAGKALCGTEIVCNGIRSGSVVLVVLSASASANSKKRISNCASYYNKTFDGGKTVILDARVNGIGLPMTTSKFNVFTKDNYDYIYKLLVNKNIKVLKDTDAKSVKDLPLNIVNVDYIK